jgi:hypothetical protein
MGSGKYALVGVWALAAAACGGSTATDASNADHDGGTVGAAGGMSGIGGSGGAGGSGGPPFPPEWSTVPGGTGGTNADAEAADLCKLTPPTPSTAEEIERDTLIRKFCTALYDGGCGSEFGTVSHEMTACSTEDRIRGCMIDIYVEYLQLDLVSNPECDVAWRTAAECAGNVDYSQVGCAPPSITAIFRSGDGTIDPCETDRLAANQACSLGTKSVTGTRGTCDYMTNTVLDPGDCLVQCNYTPYGNFAIKCGGLSGLPLTCDCYLNDEVLYDDGIGYPKQFLAADCRDAALRAVEGECLERVDCCFSWPGPETPPEEHCSCTSDPGLIGYDSCEAAAAARGGQVVQLCPQYQPNPGCLQSPELCP